MATIGVAPEVVRAFCHNDSFTEKFLFDGTVRLLDWEFAGMGDRFFYLTGIRTFFSGREKGLFV